LHNYIIGAVDCQRSTLRVRQFAYPTGRHSAYDGNRLGAASVSDTLRERREDSDCLTVNRYHYGLCKL